MLQKLSSVCYIFILPNTDVLPLDSTHFAVLCGDSFAVSVAYILFICRVNSDNTITVGTVVPCTYIATTLGKIININNNTIMVIMQHGSSSNLYYQIFTWSDITLTTIANNYFNISSYSYAAGGDPMGMTIASYGSTDMLMSLFQNGSTAFYHLYNSGSSLVSRGYLNSPNNYERTTSVAIDNNNAIVIAIDNSFVIRAYLMQYNTGVAPTILYTLTIGTFSNVDTMSVALLANNNAIVHIKTSTGTTSLIYSFKYSSTSLSGLTNLGTLFDSQTGTAYNYQSNKSIVVYPTNLIVGTLIYSGTGLGYRAVQLSGVNYDGIVGILQNSVSSGESGSVALLGSVSSCHSSLTPGIKYFLQVNSEISNVTTPYLIGRSLNATQILLKGYNVI